MGSAREICKVLRDTVSTFSPLPFYPKERKNMPRRKCRLKCYLSLRQKFTTIGFSQPISSSPSFNSFALRETAANETEKRSTHQHTAPSGRRSQQGNGNPPSSTSTSKAMLLAVIFIRTSLAFLLNESLVNGLLPSMA